MKYRITIEVQAESINEAWRGLGAVFDAVEGEPDHRLTMTCDGVDVGQDAIGKAVKYEAKRVALEDPYDKLTEGDWAHIRETVARMRAEATEEDMESGESLSEDIMTSIGYMRLDSGFEDDSGELGGMPLREDDWL